VLTPILNRLAAPRADEPPDRTGNLIAEFLRIVGRHERRPESQPGHTLLHQRLNEKVRSADSTRSDTVLTVR
jgi:hypothetical protein